MKKILLLIVPVLLLAGCTGSNVPKYVTDVDSLRAVAEPVERLTAKEKETIEELKTMIDQDGLSSLSAPAVGVNKQIVVVIDKEQPVVMINPAILESRNEQTRIETSPNVPGLSAVVKRSEKIKVSYFDENFKPQLISASGGYAAAIQHQFEFIRGMLFFDNARQVFSTPK